MRNMVMINEWRKRSTVIKNILCVVNHTTVSTKRTGIYFVAQIKVIVSKSNYNWNIVSIFIPLFSAFGRTTLKEKKKKKKKKKKKRIKQKQNKNNNKNKKKKKKKKAKRD